MPPEILPPLSPDTLVSILIVNYNYGHFLANAIESATKQTYSNLEIIVCDDGSTDNSREIIARYQREDPRVRSILKENAGVAAALNDAYAASTGAVISLLDADDIFEPAKIERVMERFRAGGRVGLVINTLVKIDSAGNPIGRIPQFGSLDRGELRNHLLRSSAHWSVAPTSGMSMRRECADEVFPIPSPQFRTEADGYMSTVAPLFYAVDVIDEPLTIYRVHSSNLTASTVVDLKWCEKGISAAQRVFAALTEIARERQWPLGPIENNPFYCEVVLIRDYLTVSPSLERMRKILQLLRAAFAVRTADRRKTRTKAVLLSVASVLPKPLGRRIINRIYLPSPLKRRLSRLTLESSSNGGGL